MNHWTNIRHLDEVEMQVDPEGHVLDTRGTLRLATFGRPNTKERRVNNMALKQLRVDFSGAHADAGVVVVYLHATALAAFIELYERVLARWESEHMAATNLYNSLVSAGVKFEDQEED